ncbi:MAG: hypothetical protein GTN49_04170 [candidate division Zixibacteria bacterium]|nr:hypothetical protein [candidate division Zixibacteria bacterium]
MPFYHRKGSKTYHIKMGCSKVPRNVRTNAEWAVRASKPKGKMCIECSAKEKPKGKKKATAKKRAAKARRRVRPC